MVANSIYMYICNSKFQNVFTIFTFSKTHLNHYYCFVFYFIFSNLNDVHSPYSLKNQSRTNNPRDCFKFSCSSIFVVAIKKEFLIRECIHSDFLGRFPW